MKCTSKQIRSLAKRVAAFLLLLFCWQASAACLLVDGDEIVAGDLARIDPAFAALSPVESVSYSPMPGQRRIISKSEWLRWAGAKRVSSSFVGETVCIERTANPLDRAEVKAAMLQAFGNAIAPPPQVDIVDICACVVPKGKFVFPLPGASAPPLNEPKTPIVWRGHVETANGHSYPIWARVTAVRPTEEITAIRPLLLGHTITESDLERKTVLDSPFRVKEAQELSFYLGKSLAQSVKAGALLEPEMVGAGSGATEVVRGSLITVEVVNGPMRLEMKARAETGGAKGDAIQLTNLKGMRRFQATVTGPNQARIVLDEKNEAAAGTSSKGTL